MSGNGAALWRLTGLIFVLLLPEVALAADWPATTAQIVPREPTLAEQSRKPDAFDTTYSFFSNESFEPAPHSLQASGFANKVFNYYRRAGHNPPLLRPYARENLPPAYRLYIFPFVGSASRDARAAAGGTYAIPCGYPNREPWIGINHDLWRTPLSAGHLWSMAHEVMHALHFGDQLFGDCKPASFEISEGIPDGAAAYITNREFLGYSGGISVSNSAVGLRSYRLPLFFFISDLKATKGTLEQHLGYGTSSFWRFLIERFGGLRIIPHMSKKSLPKNTQWEDAYRWLDERLQAWPLLRKRGYHGDARDGSEPPGLFEVYPAFVTEFASYGGERYMGFDHRTFPGKLQASEAWLRKMFRGCARVELSPSKPQGQVTIKVDEVAAACLRVTYTDFKGSVVSSIEVLHDDLAVLDGLHLGWAWKRGPDKTENCYRKREKINSKWPPCVLKAFAQEGPQAGRYARYWPTETLKFGSGNYAERTWILSNVAVDPWTTRMVENITFKVGTSTTLLKGKPARPLHERATPPKKVPATTDINRMDRETLYGLNTEPRSRSDGLMGLSLVEQEQGPVIELEGYGVMLRDMRYGKLGPVAGVVTPMRGEGNPNAGVVSSDLCKGAAGKAVAEVLQSDEEALRISVSAKLCRAGPETLKQCESAAGCPQVDTVKGEVTLAFGWRQFAETAPTDILTRGTQRYINTMPDSLAEAMQFGRNTALPDMDDPGYREETGSGPGMPGAGSGQGGAVNDCACTCEERRETERMAQAVKAPGLSDEERMEGMAGLMRCQSACQRQYMVCAMEEAEAREAAEKEALEREQAQREEQCDCSCESLNAMQRRARELEAHIGGDMGAVMEEVTQMTTCMTVCQDALMACYSGG